MSRFIEDIAGYGKIKRSARWCIEERKELKSKYNKLIIIGGLKIYLGLFLSELHLAIKTYNRLTFITISLSHKKSRINNIIYRCDSYLFISA
ncbi:MAG: hypothetical protein PUC90_00275 [Prevotella sp.]|nr:hypothetical protein [Prevotella sp.]